MYTRESAVTLFKTLRDRPPTKFERVFTLVYLLVGLIGSALFITTWIQNGKPAAFFLFIAIPYLALWLYFNWQLRNEHVCAQKMLNVLQAKADDLCWIYIEEESGARSSIQLHYCFTDRRRGIYVGSSRSVEDLFQFFYNAFSQVSTGWVAETARRCRRDPHDLKRHPRRGWERQYSEIPADNPSNGW